MEHSEIRSLFQLHRICVLIPTYNNAQTLERVINDVLSYTDQVIVVNDGSTDSTPRILEGYPAIKKVSYPNNRGKGYALRTGFAFALSEGFDHAITMDSDGQHYAADLISLLKAFVEIPEAIIVGARNMDQSTVPGKSSFGNKFSNFWFWVNTGITMQDTQSGYRLYPIRRMRNINFVTKKFEFEIEVLVRSSWNGIPVINVPVKVFYPEKGKRITHFRPFKDFTRISVLNTVLVTIALLFIKPRDIWRSLKKKTSDSSFVSSYSIRPNQMP
ncbi:glycosyltransferase family 2 protein [Chryseolinea sp. T2]|uniref:glycosyltransferase family 2 protein n=1 Tax=Chryseolinea sp. T2 TaxID=3129255 RepID=UPI0030789988